VPEFPQTFTVSALNGGYVVCEPGEDEDGNVVKNHVCLTREEIKARIDSWLDWLESEPKAHETIEKAMKQRKGA
jgi:hypothetical protein